VWPARPAEILGTMPQTTTALKRRDKIMVWDGIGRPGRFDGRSRNCSIFANMKYQVGRPPPGSATCSQRVPVSDVRKARRSLSCCRDSAVRLALLQAGRATADRRMAYRLWPGLRRLPSSRRSPQSSRTPCGPLARPARRRSASPRPRRTGRVVVSADHPGQCGHVRDLQAVRAGPALRPLERFPA
jgi:hypothetical protein